MIQARAAAPQDDHHILPSQYAASSSGAALRAAQCRQHLLQQINSSNDWPQLSPTVL
jgi:hypothetical protein